MAERDKHRSTVSCYCEISPYIFVEKEKKRNTSKSVSTVGPEGSIRVINGHLKHILYLTDDEHSVCSDAKMPITKLNHTWNYYLLVIFGVGLLKSPIVRKTKKLRPYDDEIVPSSMKLVESSFCLHSLSFDLSLFR